MSDKISWFILAYLCAAIVFGTVIAILQAREESLGVSAILWRAVIVGAVSMPLILIAWMLTPLTWLWRIVKAEKTK